MKYRKGKLNLPCSDETLTEIVNTDVLLVQLESDNMGQQVNLYSEVFLKRLLLSAKKQRHYCLYLMNYNTFNMTQQFENLVKEILKKKILITDVDMVGDSLAFAVDGFSKSGTALIYEENGKIFSKTRYDTIDEITCFKDLARVAFDWNSNYLDREPFTQYSSSWKPYFEEYGWV